ncbi:MAG: DUF493 domain-containing protein [Casimicrobiaceae bacterium]
MADTLLEFPTDFPLKIIGRAKDGFAQTVHDIVLRHAPDYDGSKMELRPSSAGNYLSVTCTVNATSQIQLDGLYRELTAHPDITMVF